MSPENDLEEEKVELELSLARQVRISWRREQGTQREGNRLGGLKVSECAGHSGPVCQSEKLERKECMGCHTQ